MSILSWGKCRIFVKNADVTGAKWYELATPVEDSTNLAPTKGDKLEAKIEGGDNEDVKYKRSTYELTYNIRKAKGRLAPFPSVDGLVDDHFGLILVAEVYFQKSTVSVDDTFTAGDGAIWEITHDAVVATTGNTVKWGTVTITTTGEGSSASTTITFTEGSTAVVNAEEVVAQGDATPA